ncbi:unnamed protein product, partial [Pylaiella littoralis]
SRNETFTEPQRHSVQQPQHEKQQQHQQQETACTEPRTQRRVASQLQQQQKAVYGSKQSRRRRPREKPSRQIGSLNSAQKGFGMERHRLGGSRRATLGGCGTQWGHMSPTGRARRHKVATRSLASTLLSSRLRPGLGGNSRRRWRHEVT